MLFRSLAALGDPRFDPERWHLPRGQDLGFVAVPAQDSYALGTRPADAQRVRQAVGRDPKASELNDWPVQIAAFHIAQYPVTVAQYRAFVNDTGYTVGDADALLDPDTRPVQYVSWDDAQAYCHWLTRQLRHSSAVAGLPAALGVRQHGWRVDLASEAEWECAARAGQVGAVYPWGDSADAEAANFRESGIGNSSAVGCFASNPWRLYDMVGNLWEWTRSAWRDSYRDPDLTDSMQSQDADVSRPVRGGSWFFSRDIARCAVRTELFPDGRSMVTFRVVLRSSLDLPPGAEPTRRSAPRRRSGL